MVSSRVLISSTNVKVLALRWSESSTRLTPRKPESMHERDLLRSLPSIRSGGIERAVQYLSQYPCNCWERVAHQRQSKCPRTWPCPWLKQQRLGERQNRPRSMAAALLAPCGAGASPAASAIARPLAHRSRRLGRERAQQVESRGLRQPPRRVRGGCHARECD